MLDLFKAAAASRPPVTPVPGLPFYFLIAIAVAGTVRSLVHLLAPDGGAGTIAPLALDAPGGRNIVAIFAQWGASQLLLALFYWVAILRYRFLTPLMLLAVFVEQCLASCGGDPQTARGCRRAALAPSLPTYCYPSP